MAKSRFLFPRFGQKMIITPSSWEAAPPGIGRFDKPRQVEATVVGFNRAHGWYRVSYPAGGTTQYECFHARPRPDEHPEAPEEPFVETSPRLPGTVKPYHKNGRRGSPVELINPDTGQVVRRFERASEAAAWLGIGPDLIYRACSRGVTAAGYLVGKVKK